MQAPHRYVWGKDPTLQGIISTYCMLSNKSLQEFLIDKQMKSFLRIVFIEGIAFYFPYVFRVVYHFTSKGHRHSEQIQSFIVFSLNCVLPTQYSETTNNTQPPTHFCA